MILSVGPSYISLIPFFSKWVHLLAVIGVAGLIVFARLALTPALRQRGAEADSQLAVTIYRRFGILLGIFWLFLILSGALNLVIFWPSTPKIYHLVLIIKVVLAAFMFLISMAITHPAPAFERFRANREAWLSVLLLFIVAIVGLSAFLNSLH